MTSTPTAPRVVMLVQNDWTMDTRVIREASALADLGYEVHVVCRRITCDAVVEHADGVTYHVRPVSGDPSPAEILALLRLHLRVYALAASSVRSPAAKARALLRGFPSAFLAIAPVGAFVVGVRGLARRFPALRPIDARMTPLVTRVARRLQPFRYLNDFALKCLDDVVAFGADVIHAHDLVTLSAATFAAGRTSATLVYDAHELETQTNYVLEPETKRAIEDYERILAPRTDNVVTVCESIADWLARHYGIEQPVVIVNSPASGLPKSRPPFGLRNVLDLDESIPLAVYVGSVTIDRGLELCVDALAALPDVHLATVGPRYVETETAMIERAAQLDVAHRLHLVDARPADEIVSFIGSASCSVMPIQNVCLSYYYCFPNKLLESVFAGLPVVVADLLELRNFVERYGVGVVVDERDPQSIAAGIRRTIEDDSLRPTEQIRREVESVYGWPHQRELLYEMYSSMRAQESRTAAACAG